MAYDRSSSIASMRVAKASQTFLSNTSIICSVAVPRWVRVGYKNCCFVHVSLIPELGTPGEQKTKPTQHSVKQMRALGNRSYTMASLESSMSSGV